jgi:predicted amidohydrolase YtcJ
VCRTSFFTLVLLFFSLVTAYTRAQQQVADTVYTNGKIYTVDESRPWAQAIAIKSGEIVALGSTDDMAAVTGDDTEVIDLDGKFAMPGIHDIHLHIQNAYTADAVEGKLLFFPNGIESVEELGKIFRDYAEKNKDAQILFAENLPYTLFPNNSPTKAFIDEILADKPVYMLSDTQHEGLLNSKAIEVEGVTAETPTPPLGEIIKDEKTGEPTGFLKEEAVGDYVWKHYPVPSPEKVRNGLQGTIAYLNSVGITSVNQVHAKTDVADGVKSLNDAGELNVRFGLTWTWNDPMEPKSLKEQEQVITNRKKFESPLVKVDAVKISGDGNPGSTAYVLEPYQGTDSRGIAYYKDEDLIATIEKFDRMGIAVWSHCIGDAAIRQFIDAAEVVKRKHGKLNARHIISHGIMLHPDDMARIKALNLSVEFSPVAWYGSDLANAQRSFLGDERMKRWFPMRSAAKAGVRFAIASDGPIAWHDPLVALESAVTRKAQRGKGDPLSPGEAIDVATGVKAMTLDAAYMMNQDNEVGSLQVGKRADMIILDQNILEIPPPEIGATKVLFTLLDGKVVFAHSDSPVDEDAIEENYGIELDFDTSGVGSPHGQYHGH